MVTQTLTAQGIGGGSPQPPVSPPDPAVALPYTSTPGAPRPSESHRDRLVALRDRLERAIDAAGENMLPALAAQYRATLDDLARVDADVAPPARLTDDLKAKRSDRRKRRS